MDIPIGISNQAGEPSIDEQSIHKLVHRFYDRVREHDSLGPFFDRAIAADQWPAHLETMCNFWSSTLLASRKYYGNPREVHRVVPGIAAEHFRDWLALFEETVHEIFPRDAAERISAKAQRMGQVLSLAALGKPWN